MRSLVIRIVPAAIVAASAFVGVSATHAAPPPPPTVFFQDHSFSPSFPFPPYAVCNGGDGYSYPGNCSVGGHAVSPAPIHAD